MRAVTAAAFAVPAPFRVSTVTGASLRPPASITAAAPSAQRNYGSSFFCSWKHRLYHYCIVRGTYAQRRHPIAEAAEPGPDAAPHHSDSFPGQKPSVRERPDTAASSDINSSLVTAAGTSDSDSHASMDSTQVQQQQQRPPSEMPAPPAAKRKVHKIVPSAKTGSGLSDGDVAVRAVTSVKASEAKLKRSRRPKSLVEAGKPTAVVSDSVPPSYDSTDQAASSTAGRKLKCTLHDVGAGGAVTPTAQAAAAATGLTGGVADQRFFSGDRVGGGEAGASEVAFSSKLPRGSAWLEVRQWVVFSDLHVREISLPTCLEVLRAVNAEAGKRQAGVLFLGDFWDRRGALPVEPLNQVLQEMSSWSCPVLMLVGNHDQVDLGGLQHGLTPLELACPHVHVFEEPTRWHGALWLPYRRETWILERAMAMAQAAAAAVTEAAGESLNAIFLHADVRTARTNQWRQAEEGLEPGAFPPHVPVYSGHYHLPHTVRGTNITYIGSPYQVSMNEASETKRLLVLEAPSWRIVEEIPLAIGPRHLRLNGPAACDQLRQLANAAASVNTGNGVETNGDGSPSSESSEESEGAAGVGLEALPPPSPALRYGDRVKLWLRSTEAQDERVLQAIAELTRAGVSVEQVLQPGVRASRVQAAEGLTVEQMVDLYCNGGGVNGEGLTWGAAAEVRSAVAQARDAAGAGADAEWPSARCVELELDSVRLRGFGPFVDEQTYPLAGRGVRVIVGENQDEPGADSNGAGKTSLVTAPLWALTGEVLARTESGGGGRVPVDVMRNDRCGSCTVGLNGRLNGEPFQVVREIKRGKTSSLTLRLGDEDLTLQDISGTAEHIRRLFATDLLRCSVFFGQNDITGLLEANDATLKQKLGLVVDLEIWEAARQLLAAPRKSAAATASEEAGRARVLAQQRARRAEEVAELQRLEANWATEHERRLESHQAVLTKCAAQAIAAAAELQPRAQAARRLVSELRLATGAAEEELRRWEAELGFARQSVELAAMLPGPQSSPLAPPSKQQLQWNSKHGQQEKSLSHAALQQQQRQEELEAAQVLKERQAEEARVQQLLSELQSAAAQALGRLRQQEASLKEYQAAVAAAAAAAVTSRPATADAVVSTVRNSAAADHLPKPDKLARSHRTILQRQPGNSNGEGHGYGKYSRTGKNVQPLLEWSDEGGAGPGGEESAARVVAAGHQHQHSNLAILAVCDRCRQPISELQYAANVERLQQDIVESRKAYDEAAGTEREAQAARTAAASRVAEASAAVLALQRRRIELERRAAAEALAAATAAEREARAAEGAARHAREEAWREAEGLLRELQSRMATSSRTRGDLLAAAADLECVASELEQAAAAWALHAESAHRHVAAIGCTDLTQTLLNHHCHDVRKGLQGVEDGTAFLYGTDGSLAALNQGEAAAAMRPFADLLVASREAAASGRAAALAAARSAAVWKEAGAVLERALRELNPESGLLGRAQRELEDLEGQLAYAEAAATAADAHLAALNDADRALGRSGIPSLVLEDVLAQLQAYTASFLNELCDGFVLELSATKPAAGGAGAGGGGGSGGRGGNVREKEEIQKVVKARNPADGSLRQRDVRQLSGGERRRVALALSLGFEELVRRRRRLICNVLVLDEVLQQLDNTGCELVARVLRDLPHASVLVVGQTNSSVTSNFDLMDVVVKEAGASYVRATV